MKVPQNKHKKIKSQYFLEAILEFSILASDY